MTEKFDIVHIDGYMHIGKSLVKSEDFPYIVLEKLVDGEWCLWQVDNGNDWDEKNQLTIVASNKPSLGLPLLPSVEVNIDQLAREDAEIVCGGGAGVSPVARHVIGFVNGYKAAKAKKYTEEDMVNLYNLATGEMEGTGFVRIMDVINPKPIAVEIEMENYNARPDLGNFLIQSDGSVGPLIMQRVKVDENNFVKVVNWIYE
jgi:hypothetical protein